MTNTPRLRNPRKLGLLVDSWLRRDVRGTECTANVCLYFLAALYVGETGSLETSVVTDFRGPFAGLSRPVAVAVLIAYGMLLMLAVLIDAR